jgi:hypothetical protein
MDSLRETYPVIRFADVGERASCYDLWLCAVHGLQKRHCTYEEKKRRNLDRMRPSPVRKPWLTTVRFQDWWKRHVDIPQMDWIAKIRRLQICTEVGGYCRHNVRKTQCDC